MWNGLTVTPEAHSLDFLSDHVYHHPYDGGKIAASAPPLRPRPEKKKAHAS